MRDIAIASLQFVHQHDNVRRPGESHRGAGRKKKWGATKNEKPKQQPTTKKKSDKKPQTTPRDDGRALAHFPQQASKETEPGPNTKNDIPWIFYSHCNSPAMKLSAKGAAFGISVPAVANLEVGQTPASVILVMRLRWRIIQPRTPPAELQKERCSFFDTRPAESSAAAAAPWYEWIARDRRDEVYSAVTSKHPWMPEQTLPSGFHETIIFGYAADATPLPTYVCLPSGLYRSRTGRMVEREGRHQEIISLPGIFFFDGWRVQPSLIVPGNVPQTRDVPDGGTPRAKAAEAKDETPQPEEEARDILAAAYKNQVGHGPGTRRAAIRACKYLKVLVERHGKVIHQVHMAAREHTQESKLSAASKQQQQSTGGTLPKITPELTSELLHCLNAIPDPWPMAKIAIDMEKPAQWVTKMCRLYFADIYILEKQREFQNPIRHQEWNLPYRKCSNSCQTLKQR